MTIRPSKKRRNERGAALIHMAIAMVALMAFSALVIDYGIFWVARRQAQNSADAGALAGAMALAFDNPTDFSATGPAKQNAKAAALTNIVWGVAPSVLDSDITFPSCPDNPADTCVKVDVFRTVARSNSLPTFFGKLVGINTQDVQATATAAIVSGTQSNCLRPWMMADKWLEHSKCTAINGSGCQSYAVNNQPWTLLDTYDKWAKSGGGPWVLDPLLAGLTPDEYREPGAGGTSDPGTGFRLKNIDGTYADYGQFMEMKLGGGENVVSPGWFLAVDMAQVWPSDPNGSPTPAPRALCTDANCPNGGSNLYNWTIKNCAGGTAGVGDWLKVETGAMTGPTGQGSYTDSDSLLARDPGATWNDTTKQIENSCAPGVCADGRYYAESPRIVPVSLFDLDAYLNAGYTGSNGYARITNVFGFFVMSRPDGVAMAAAKGLDTSGGTSNGKVYGIMVSAPGLTSGTSTIPPTSSFLLTIVLVR